MTSTSTPATTAPKASETAIPVRSAQQDDLTALCHCKRVQITIPSAPERLNECRCTICYRYGALWAYYSMDDVQISPVAEGSPEISEYVRSDSDGDIRFCFCSHCGCMTHWLPNEGKMWRPGQPSKMGVNTRMLAEKVAQGDGMWRKVTHC